MQHISIGGLNIHNVTMQQAVGRCLELAASGGGAVYTPNAEMAKLALDDPAFLALLNRGDLVVPDGAGVVLAAKLLGTPLAGKVAGVELAQNLLAPMQQRGLSLFLFGGKPGVAQRAAQAVRAKYPGLAVCGVADGYFDDEAQRVGLIAQSGQPESGFYLYDQDGLAARLQELESRGKKTMLWGVSYALLDLAESRPMPLKHTVILETGGMKGRRKEMLKEELHQVLCQAFHLDAIHSEYGMCELLSQAYSVGDGLRFQCPPWMKILIRQSQDPLCWEEEGRSGGINVIDLGNMLSCPFIATQDLGKLYPDGSFAVLGRFDNSDIRGCNLMVD